MLPELSYRSGYLKHIRPYDIRRVQRTSWTVCIFHLATTQANTVVDSVQVSGDAMRQIMGHVQHSKTYHQHYQFDISTVDIKGLVLRDACDTGFSMDVLRRNRRVRRLPARLPSRAHQEYLRNWKETIWADRTISRDVHGKQARTAACELFRTTWVQTDDSGIQLHTLPSLLPAESVEMLGDLNDIRTKSKIMMRYDRHRKVISEEIANRHYNLRTSHALDSMTALAKIDYMPPARFYTGTEPTVNALNQVQCRFCNKLLHG
jgi:hypothetical protein